MNTNTKKAIRRRLAAGEKEFKIGRYFYCLNCFGNILVYGRDAFFIILADEI